VKAVVLLWLAACGPGLAPRDPHDVARDALVASADNADDLEWLFHDSVVDGGIWFPDGACASQFANPGAIAKAKLHAFASCLANLHLRASTRDDALGDVVVLDYGPGIELEARIVQELDAPHLTWIGYASRRPGEPMVPTITADALDRVRTAGDRNGPLDPAVAATLKLDPTPTSHAQFTWVRLCVDQNGAVTTLHAGETTSVEASKAFEAAAKAWTFKPFTIQGHAAPVCASVRMAYPPGQAPKIETLPMPPPPKSKNSTPVIEFALGAKVVDAKRISGERLVKPDVNTAKAISKSQVSHRIVGRFRLCLDETGTVISVLPMKSTGYADYDRELMARMATWRYSPFEVDGTPAPVCTTITFVYGR
jgi:hypothetical protein